MSDGKGTKRNRGDRKIGTEPISLGQSSVKRSGINSALIFSISVLPSFFAATVRDFFSFVTLHFFSRYFDLKPGSNLDAGNERKMRKRMKQKEEWIDLYRSFLPPAPSYGSCLTLSSFTSTLSSTLPQ